MKQIGQFYTNNYDYIFQGLSIPPGEKYIEPFADNGDLVEFIKSKTGKESVIESYDIEPQKDYIMKRDTFLNSP